MRIAAAFALAASLAGCAGSGMQSVRPGMPVLAADTLQNRVAQDQGVLMALGQTAAPGAIVFAPGPQDAKEWLSKQADFPPTKWRAHKVVVSCDGTTGVVTGAIEWGEYPGYYTTIWQQGTGEELRDRGTWRWVLSHGDGVDKPRPEPQYPLMIAASCKNLPNTRATGAQLGGSPDGSLRYSWDYSPEEGRRITVERWNGSAYEIALEDRVAGGQSPQ